jgi:hypothetical protein
MFVLPHTVLVAQSHEEAKNKFMPAFNSLKEKGFSGSLLDRCNIKIIEENLAVADTHWTRLGRNNEILEQLGIMYTLQKTKAGWKVVVVTAHDKDLVLIQ